MERYYPIRTGQDGIHLKPGQSTVVTFDGTGIENADRLHITGETCQFFQWKNEPDHPMLYRRIDDSLNTEKAVRDQHCLEFTSDGTYPVLAYHKVEFPVKLSYLKLNRYGNDWTLGISVSGAGVTLQENGYLRFRAEVFLRQEGEAPNSLNREPDRIFDLDLPLGTYEYTVLSRQMEFDAKNAAAVCLYLEGEGFTGTVYAEEPVFRSDSGWNMAPPFAPNSEERPQFTWYGANLSRKEWVSLSCSLNGKPFFEGDIFERCHRRSEGEIPLNGAEILPGKNQLEITLTSRYRDPLAYDLYDVALLGWDPSFVVACPETVTAGAPFPVFVEGKAGTSVILHADKVTGVDLTLPEEGLNAVLLRCDAPENDISFALEYEGKRAECEIQRCVLRPEDRVITGTGDMVYVNNEDRDMDNFLKWYFSNKVGNLVTIRPTYRWSGIRSYNNTRWTKTARLLDKAGIKYVHMMDGRELPGCDSNPPIDTMEGANFCGRQNHELDGAFSYWGVWDHTNSPSQTAFLELFLRRSRKNGANMSSIRGAASNFIEKQGKKVYFRDITLPSDMEVLANYTVNKLIQCKNGAVRHTGPSSLFKYFYQAGYDWTGAELMYGPQETTCAAMRGAAKAYGKPVIGAHHAIQWSTTPHDSKEKNLRYRLALFGTYLQGVHDINTEEGLWHVEEYYSGYNRFSPCCKNHTREQQDFYRYVQTHSRTGTFHTPIAFLHGRFDGWDVFTQRKIWGRESMGYKEPEKAWNLIKLFYPRNELHSLYRHPCPSESVGYYSGTPFGNVDAFPIEAENYGDYKLLIAAGYNKALPEDFDKLQTYAEEGGTLVIGWPQCSVTTLRTDVLALNHQYIDHPFRTRIAPDAVFSEDTYEGIPVTVGTLPSGAEPVLTTDSGNALIYRLSAGVGTVYFVNAKEYAGSEGVARAVTELLNRLVPETVAKEEIYGQGDENVQFAVYDQEDGSRHVYFTATDWYNGDEALREGTLITGGHRYTVPAPLGYPVKAVVKDGVAVWCNDWENDVLSVSETGITLQGRGVSDFTVGKNGTTRTLRVDFSDASVKTVSL